jgi:hypothetical protein
VSANGSWVGLWGVVLGAVLGFVAGELKGAADRRRQKRGLLLTLQSDVGRNVELFKAYRRDGVEAPAYRLGVETWGAALPFLAGLNSLTTEQIRVLARFFSVSTEMNYCLDRIADASGQASRKEVNRAHLKVSNVLDTSQLDGATIPPLSERAQAAIRDACQRAGI